MKKETPKKGRHKLSNLARSLFDLSTLDSQLNDIVSFFFCKKWHSGRQQNLRIPLGGAKQSGIGRELGEAGLSAYSNVKAIHVNMQSRL